MADGEFTVKLDDESAKRLRVEAEAQGMPPEVLAAVMLSEDLLDVSGGWADPDPAIDLAILEEFERTRMGVPWEAVKAWMQSWGTTKELPKPRVRRL